MPLSQACLHYHMYLSILSNGQIQPACLSVSPVLSLSLFFLLSPPPPTPPPPPHLSVSLSLSHSLYPSVLAHLLYPLLEARELCLACGTDSSSMSSASCSAHEAASKQQQYLWDSGTHFHIPEERDWATLDEGLSVGKWGLGAGEEFLGTQGAYLSCGLEGNDSNF